MGSCLILESITLRLLQVEANELRQHVIYPCTGQMENDSSEKVDTQHGSCYSHLLAPESAMHSSPLI